MKRFLTLSLLFLSACNLPGTRAGTDTPTPILLPTASPAATVPPQPTPQLGSEDNPLILALAPSAHPSPEMIEAGELLAAQLEALTGYQIVTVAPASEAELVQAFEIGNAHMAVLSPFAYLLLHEAGHVSAGLASVRAQ